ncbi:helix-turn-helix transcriptional regulator [Pseudoteredinibacter isoporae]|uniref:DNA-binding CsgD family transcriptional regulator n=1 Tax=Pseudoteredinibacter isoporae TaxID=570281 RepID=A0A7X0JUJ1_9GAMM|nr:helix-turn-helix transcriptional regulator [Pseudoteredinibacter isoporae]MBB6522519.1 DNA-binding CsgD family transcriptional regulator [Pseudoteredinibacter isoporae]NHO88048.1 LuxR family transcriptional regulator [Pseudoteredinibacter isoporae]NIB23621.1 LuxR family transcriptional regulator [Pseudoteredinibacter isoporae]
MKKEPLDTYPSRFQHEALALIEGLVSITSSAFYLIGANSKHHQTVRHNLPSDIGKQYSQKYHSMDPLWPSQFNNTCDRVVTIDSVLPQNKLHKTIYYQDFMKPNNHRYVADILFRQQGEVIAVISLIRSQDIGQFSEEELSALKTLQPFLEFTLNSIYLPKRFKNRGTLGERFQLTPREIDVLERAVSGLSNSDIAIDLNIKLSTVKTHLISVFKKAKVSSRAELIAKALKEVEVR